MTTAVIAVILNCRCRNPAYRSLEPDFVVQHPSTAVLQPWCFFGKSSGDRVFLFPYPLLQYQRRGQHCGSEGVNTAFSRHKKLRERQSMRTLIRIDESKALIAPTRKEVILFFSLLTLSDSHKYAGQK